MNEASAVGLHGKLPQQRDFVTRNLPLAFCVGWDEWMQRSLLASQEALGNGWLEVYLTSPVWRFVLSQGILDQRVWAGVMVPSVDKVGRYYPLVLAQPLAADTLPTAPLLEAADWFDALEAFAVEALQAGHSFTEIEHRLQQLRPLECHHRAAGKWEPGRPLALFIPPQQSPGQGYPYLLHELLQQRLSAYSLWSSAGSERVAPAHLISGYLPAAQCYTSLLTGGWAQCGWSTPLNAITPLAFFSNNCNNTHEIQNE
ncbi:MAG: type VI secretion system-associated protein TagF [Pseudomonadales bacterium]|jgi:type VI secretion system protein ImpM|uniref:type VI secretion system-associated protein TagF n=1 Tax=unclassified Ketobacter TaxID=2639109 RepID=UPI000C524728|nr:MULTISPECIES: type VI secretion system-associated protein TagF [unclassified Ketobacter]MAQ25638.1 type VI secretion system-associated protein TagF [Pseudomonadales bacterium]HAG95273.1 type VI secretion system-associated protein TagF [Gammaproteobacteria bacterium]MBI25660.1 type VI secretion system-associated protein TagF [Pseudomonadales bacterium]RLT91145.1 MAG: type VI secretion system-associated protein TagF [Ketobacter sp. GenoA1]RLT98420.1 MAG: type VI secretion system-associated pr|tara:strand:+ start:24330 stop:25100 length:771 start_codon:yes stop_codon:yes gene_type:complete